MDYNICNRCGRASFFIREQTLVLHRCGACDYMEIMNMIKSPNPRVAALWEMRQAAFSWLAEIETELSRIAAESEQDKQYIKCPTIVPIHRCSCGRAWSAYITLAQHLDEMNDVSNHHVLDTSKINTFNKPIAKPRALSKATSPSAPKGRYADDDVFDEEGML